MVLSQPDIRKAVKGECIVFSPVLEKEQWGEASVGLRIGFSFTVLRNDLTGVRVSVDGAARTNAGVFNNSNRSQTVTARVYYPDSDSEDPDPTLTFSLPPKGWVPKPVTARGERGYIFWRIPREACLWVVNVDNRSNDGTLSVPILLP